MMIEEEGEGGGPRGIRVDVGSVDIALALAHSKIQRFRFSKTTLIAFENSV